MLRGLTTVSFYADDLTAAKQWYSEFLGVDAYYAYPPESPAYVEFRIGDYEHELGIIDGKYRVHPATEQAAGEIVYWHVDDLQATLDRLIELGATLHDKITPRGAAGDFITASVVDPFGNVLGIMSNPHYLQILARGPQG
ncbi:VOC family protein [Tenggerimyces flavus]|uniref:VOC family protein n=1 Tax=Tenggerimyces flavus TaxID=1708749 RepID=A0ABV7YJP5_9ACTN|nr:VOC family protein [Tenggerimyces flavus]MBM7789894.1 putative enzyme related to lactoylglutathione lyase [Tenggerimyces flavus]